MMPEPQFHLMAVGDIMLGDSSHFLGRGMGARIARYGTGFPFEKVKGLFAEADIFVGNLESPLSRSIGISSWDKVYRGSAVAAGALCLAKRNIVTLANNHILEHGGQVLDETRCILDKVGVHHAGLSANGGHQRAALDWVQDGVPFLLLCESLVGGRSRRVVDAAEIEEWLIESLRAAAPAVRIVALHWGQEYVQCPSAEQHRLGHLLIENGASLVLGHHPHVLQPVEQVGSGLVAYSLGNFLFDQNWTNETRAGGILDVKLTADGVLGWRLVPTFQGADGRPRPATEQESLLIDGVIRGATDCEADRYRRLVSQAARRHRFMMKWELLKHFPQVGWDTWNFLATKRRRRQRECDRMDIGG